MDIRVSSKKVANNILEFLVDPSAFPLERRLYFRPEEILINESFEKAKKESQQTYGDQRHNSDFYPKRPCLQREASTMERKTLIASLDVLSQEFAESDPMAKDLRTMAYAVSKMSDEDLETRLAGGNPWIEHMNKVRKDNPGKSFKEIASLAKKTFKKADEAETETKEASEEVLADDTWTKEASDAIQRALVAEIAGEKVADCGKPHEKEEEEKSAGDAKGPGVPDKDGKGPLGGTPACSKNKEAEATEEPKEAAEEKEATEEPKEVTKEASAEPVVEEPKEATVVDTEVLKASTNFGGVEINAGMMTLDDIGDLSGEEQERLGQLFK